MDERDQLFARLKQLKAERAGWNQRMDAMEADLRNYLGRIEDEAGEEPREEETHRENDWGPRS